jgi:hypothetical protein
MWLESFENILCLYNSGKRQYQGYTFSDLGIYRLISILGKHFRTDAILHIGILTFVGTMLLSKNRFELLTVRGLELQEQKA